ncbi:MAG: hypothetical protein WCI06_04265, partial [Methylococcaceae bacterium]
MASIKYSSIRIDSTGSYVADVTLSGDNFYDDATGLNIGNNLQADLLVSATNSSQATLTFSGANLASLVDGSVVTVDLSAAPFESGDLPDGVRVELAVVTTNNGGNGTDPVVVEPVLTFDDVTGDNTIDLTEQAAGVELTGTADATVAKVILTFSDGTTTKEATIADGIWSYTLTAEDYTAGVETVSATAQDADGNPIVNADGSDVIAFPTSDVIVNAPEVVEPILTFEEVAGDNTIDLTEQAAGVELTG